MGHRKVGNGRGSVWAERGGYVGRIVLPDGTTRRKRCRTHEEAAAWVAAALTNVRQGKAPPSGQLRVAEYLDRWLAECVRPHREPKTYRSYEQLVRVHIQPALGKHRLRDLGPQHVQRLVNQMQAAGKAPATVQRMRAVLRVALNQALDWGLVEYNAAARRLQLPKVDPERIEGLSVEEAQIVLDVLRPHRLYALFALAIAAGARQGELLGLRWEDVDLEAGVVAIRRQLQRIEGAYRYKAPKQHSVRDVHLPRQVVAILREHRERQRAEREASPDWADPALVFTTERGAPLHGSTVTHTFRRLLRRAGYAPLSFHYLRHAAASLMFALGCTPIEVSATLGHRDASVTTRVYAHLIEGAREEVARRMEGVFGGADAATAPTTAPTRRRNGTR